MPRIIDGYVVPDFPDTGYVWRPAYAEFAHAFETVLKQRRDDKLAAMSPMETYYHPMSEAIRDFIGAREREDAEQVHVYYRFLFTDPDLLPYDVRGSHKVLKSMYPTAVASEILTRAHIEAYSMLREALREWLDDYGTGMNDDIALIIPLGSIVFEDLNPERVKTAAHLIKQNVVSEPEMREQLNDLAGVSIALLDGAL